MTVRPRRPLGRCGEERFSQFLVVTREKLIGGHELTPEPAPLQAKEPRGSQPVVVRSVFLTCADARGSSLDPLKLLHMLFELRSPKVEAVLQLRPQQGRAEGEKDVPGFA